MSDTHRAASVTRNGAAQGLCFRSPRHLTTIKWTLDWSMVTCPRCLAKRSRLPGEDAASQRWRALSPQTQWRVLFDLHVNIKIREYKILHWPDAQVDKAAMRTEVERDRALLDMLEPVTPADVFADAKKIGERP